MPEDKYSTKSYNPNYCCGTDCNLYGRNENESCWGDVDVVDEVLNYEGDYEWIHACQGHWEVLQGYGKYKEENVNEH